MGNDQITVTSAMLNKAKGTVLVSHLKVRPAPSPELPCYPASRATG